MTSLPPPPTMNPYEMPGMAPKRPVWPLVIGIITIALGALEVAAVPLTFAGDLLPKQPNQPKIVMPPWHRAYEIYMPVGRAALMICAGVLLIRRRPLARLLHLIYGVLGIILVAVGIAIIWAIYPSLADQAPADMREVMFATLAGSAVCGAVFGLAYPVFVLVWFLRPAIRQEVDRWRTQSWVP